MLYFAGSKILKKPPTSTRTFEEALLDPMPGFKSPQSHKLGHFSNET